MTVNGAGSAPARSRIARSFADCTVKLPEICPCPPVIGSRITGAEITSLSSTMAKGCPTFSVVARARIEGSLRIRQIAACDQHLLLDHIGHLRGGRAHQEL